MAYVSKRATARVVDRLPRVAWLALAASGLVLGAASYSRAQSVPSGQPIEIIVPFGPGGGADEVARFSAPMLQADMHAPVTINNVSGATGNAGMARLLAAPSDGHTLAVLTNDTFASLAFDNATWKPDDVIALAILTRQNSALFVPSGSPYARWQDFADHARKAPRSLRVAISGYGSPDYIALEQLSATGIALAPVPIDDPQQRFQAVLNGQADALYEQPGDVRRFLEAGQMRPVLMFSATRDPDFKDVPASGELGIGSGMAQFRAIVVKAGTDPQTVASLAGELDHMASAPEFKTFLARQMAASDSFAPSKDARAFLQRQMAAMQHVVAGMPMHARFPVEDKPRDEAAPPSF